MDINIAVIVFCSGRVLALRSRDSAGKMSYDVPSGVAKADEDLLKRAGAITYSAIRRRVKELVFVKNITIGKEVTIIYRAEIADTDISPSERYMGASWLSLEAAAKEERFPFLIRGVCTYLYGLNQISERNNQIAADAAYNKCLSLSGADSVTVLDNGDYLFKVKRRNYCYLAKGYAAFKLMDEVADVFVTRFGFIEQGGYKGSDWYKIVYKDDTDITILLDMITVSYEQMLLGKTA